MEKQFQEVFPDLRIEGGMAELLDTVEVSRVSINKKKDLLRIYVVSHQWIHKKYIYQLERQIEEQLFSNVPLRVKIIERFYLSRQYTPENFLEVYAVNTALESAGSFHASFEPINRLQTLGLRTILSNYHGIPEDCHLREKCGWLGDAQLVSEAASLKNTYAHEMDTFAPHNALSAVFKVIQRANKYIDENAPWALAKDMEANGARLAHVLYNLLEATRICGILLTPFIPESMEKLFVQIGAGKDAQTWDSADLWGVLPETAAVVKGENLFPRVDAAKALEELEIAEAEARKAALPAVETEPQLTEKVDFYTFCMSDFRVVKVKACEAVKKSEKLLRFTLDDGTGTDRQILSGIHKFYEPEELVGKTLAAIVNLPPRKMMGFESNGMLLSAVHTEKGEEKLNLIMLDDKIPAGSKLC